MHSNENHNEELAGYEGSKLAMWIFLSTELLLFGVLFAVYAILHGVYPEEFKLAHHSLNKWMGLLNTVILISSSLSVALSLDSIQRGNPAKTSRLLMLTIFLAGCFLVVKFFEYNSKFQHGILPGEALVYLDSITGQYVPVKPEFKNGINLFFSLYFVMTGIHGAHVIIGIAVLSVILVKNMKGRYSQKYYTPLENSALYWHLVDLIWIYLFPLLYLIK